MEELRWEGEKQLGMLIAELTKIMCDSYSGAEAIVQLKVESHEGCECCGDDGIYHHAYLEIKD